MNAFGLSRRGTLLGVLGCLAAVGLAVPTTAAAKVTSLTSCQPISSPGKYRLDADVVASSFSSCFEIDASDVMLGLNGHTITASFSGVGIEVFGSGANIVGPGTISGFGAGIVFGAGDGSVRAVTATGNGVGIAIEGSGDSVRGNVTTDNSGFGISVDSGATGNTIIGNQAQGNIRDDLFDGNTNCDSNVWSGNDFGTANQPCIQ